MMAMKPQISLKSSATLKTTALAPMKTIAIPIVLAKTTEERFGAREEELITDDGIYWEKDETKVGKKWWRAPRILHRH